MLATRRSTGVLGLNGRPSRPPAKARRTIRAPRFGGTPAFRTTAAACARASGARSRTTPVNTATSTAIPSANPSCRDMFTMPEPSPSSWPDMEPIAPTFTVGKLAPIPTPINTSAGRMRR